MEVINFIYEQNKDKPNNYKDSCVSNYFLFLFMNVYYAVGTYFMFICGSTGFAVA